jgi:trypsin
MFSFIVCISVIHIVYGGLTNRIIEGVLVGKMDPIYKSIVRLRSNGEGFCGGTIIGSSLDTSLIITAAHCLNNAPTNLDIEFQGVAYPIESYRIHGKYEGISNDIACMITKGPLPSDAVPAMLDGTLLAEPYQCDANQLVVAGWGVTNISNPDSQSKNLMKAIVPVYNQQACQRVYPSVSMENICAGYKNGGKDSCYGDSGGPLYFYQGGDMPIVLEGLVSYGRKCGLANFPGVYVRISSYIGWIKEQVKKWNNEQKLKDMFLISESTCITRPPTIKMTEELPGISYKSLWSTLLNVSSSIIHAIQVRG